MASGGRAVLGILTYGFTIGLVCMIAAAGWCFHQYTKPGLNAEPVQIHIERGTNIGGVADTLVYENVIEQPLLLRAVGRITGKASQIKAGEYEIAPNASLKDILHKLVKGDTIERRFTIREGLTSYETAQIVKDVENLSGELSRTPPEGALLPNTYDYQKDEQRDVVLGRLQEAMSVLLIEQCKLDEELGFDAMLEKECIGAPQPLTSVKDVLTLASIVEKETAIADERRRVAGVFLNRLRKNIALQTDPTVIYAITKGKHKNDGKGPLGRRLLRKDLQLDDPYNTYKYPGLPPGPIANPGKASIEAVMNPEAHDYIYFVADGSGGHAFAKTLKEHNANVAKWRKIRRAQ